MKQFWEGRRGQRRKHELECRTGLFPDSGLPGTQLWAAIGPSGDMNLYFFPLALFGRSAAKSKPHSLCNVHSWFFLN